MECRFLRSNGQHATPPTLVVDFHFNPRNSGDSIQIRNFVVDHHGIRFSAGGVARSGFNAIVNSPAALDDEANEVLRLLQSCTAPEQLHDIRLMWRDGAVRFHVKDILARLPGGAGKRFPSIGDRDYSAFRGDADGQIRCGTKGLMLCTPYTLLSAAAPLPMIPLPAETSFASVREAGIQLAYSAHISNAEETQALRLWSGDPDGPGVSHYAEFNFNHDFVIMALRFGRFQTLASLRDEESRETSFRLPKDLHCRFVLRKTLPAVKKGKAMLREIESIEGFLMDSTAQYPVTWDPSQRRPDAVFRIVSHRKEEMVDRDYGPVANRVAVSCEPHFSSFTYHSQMNTVN